MTSLPRPSRSGPTARSAALAAALACSLGAGPASATEPPPAPTAWYRAAAEGVPDLSGAGRLRSGHSLAVEAPFPAGWELTADAQVLDPAAGGSEIDVALLRFVLRGRGERASLAAGRFARLVPGGVRRLDGVAVDLSPGGPLAPSLWVGRTWRPEHAFSPSGTFVAGSALALRPRPGPGAPPGVPSADLSAELRGEEGRFAGRFSASGGVRSGRGDAVTGLAEVEVPAPSEADTDPRGRLVARAVWVAGRRVTVGGQARWEGLPPDDVAVGSPAPLEWLAPDGYGAALATLDVDLGGATLSFEGGPTARPGEGGAVGASARARATLGGGPVRFGWSALAAGIAPSWVAGGAASVSAGRGAWIASAEGGAFHVTGLDGRPAWIGEARVHAEARLAAAGAGAPGEMRLALDVAGGADRLRNGWIRAGVSWIGEIGGRRRR